MRVANANLNMGLLGKAMPLAVGVALAFGWFGAQPASAAGCGPGLIGTATQWKDRNLIYDFVAVCDWHDRCYASRGYGWDPVKSPGRALTPYPRGWCDEGFLRAMNRSCDQFRSGPVRNRMCHSVATAFGYLVRRFGGPSYAASDGRRVLRRLAWPA